ncbi:MAG: histidine kinase dimerization/phosphoacceptor domain-containing protein, partial [Candidatus Acidiferrum sp.]
MTPHPTDQHYFERQIVYARPIIIVLAILALFELAPSRELQRSVSFLITYLLLSLVVLRIESLLRNRGWHLPLACDILALGFFLFLSPLSVPVWFPYLFVCYAAGVRWGLDGALPVAGLLALGLVLFTAGNGEIHLMRVISWLAITGGTFAGGAGLAFLGDVSRRYAVENAFFSRITSTMNVEQGLAESLRLLLEELAVAFSADEAMLLYRDADLERIFLWRLRTGESERLVPDTLPLSRTDGFLLDDLEATLCWNSLVGPGSGFGWDRRDGRPLKNLPRIPGPTQSEMKIRSLMTVAFDQAGAPVGRFFLLNGRKGNKPFEKADLAWLERIAFHVSPSLENIFLLRHLRARAIEAERSRISRDLHDGILQTLLSVEIQLDVLRRRVPTTPDQAISGLANLQQTVRNEGAELRHMVTDLRPLRV